MKILRKQAERVRNFLLAPLLKDDCPAYQTTSAIAQIHLQLEYAKLVAGGRPLPAISEFGFKVYSQTDEDGLLLYLFAILGTTNKVAVEICAGDGMECNTANLLINHGWHALLLDGNADQVRKGDAFYRQNPATYVYPPKFVHAWVTVDNVNELLTSNGISGEIDLLSIDIDGVDYWIWKTIEVISPRVVVVEYQDIVGPDRALTVPYSDSFDAYEHPMTEGMPNFCGASLPAFAKLAETKGYRLVGCNRFGYNAFFIKMDLGSGLATKRVHDCFDHPKVQWGMRERYPTVKDYPWVEV